MVSRGGERLRNPSQNLEAIKNGEAISDAQHPLLELAEQALAEDESELLRILTDELSEAERCTLQITRCRIEGRDAGKWIKKALLICQTPGCRDLQLEGRVRMERGLQRFMDGDLEGADDDLTWAEKRLGSVAMAGRNHDLSLLNKAAFHLSCDAPLMALHVYGEISVKRNHAFETLALSRIGAARILASIEQSKQAIRNAWNAIGHADSSSIPELQWQARTLFLGLAADHLAADCETMKVQVETSLEEQMVAKQEQAKVSLEDFTKVFDIVCKQHPPCDGPDRPDLRGLLLAGVALDRLEDLEWLIESPEEVDDPLLASGLLAVLEGVEAETWSARLTTLTVIT